MARIYGINKVINSTTSPVTSKNATLPLPLLVGTCVVVAGHIWAGTDPTGIAVTDGLGTSYTVQETASMSWSSGVSRGYIARGITIAAGSCVVTVTSGVASSQIEMGVYEIPEANATPLDVDGGESTATSTAASDTIVTVADDAAVIGLLVIGAGGAAKTMTVGAGNTIMFQQPATTNAAWALSWRRKVSHGSTTISWTTDNIPWIVRTLSIKGG